MLNRSNFLGTKFTVYDSQPRQDTSIQPNCKSHRRIYPKQLSPRVSVSNYSVATISYELNVFRTRGPRRMQCTIHSIPISAIQEGGTAPTPMEFTNFHGEQCSSFSISKGKKPLVETFALISKSLSEWMDLII
jgi:tubby-related protein 1